MLRISAVSKSFGATRILDAVSAEMSAGGVTLLTGPNGSGKTTLIRCVLGIETHTGEITWAGERLRPSDRRCAPVFDDTPLHPKLTGLQNLRVLGGQPLGRAAVRYLDQATLKARVSSYSFGQRKRLALMIALNSDAPFVALDEPFNGLDETGAAQLRDDVGKMSATRGFLVTAHTMSPDDALVDHAYVLDGGKLVEIVNASLPRDQQNEL